MRSRPEAGSTDQDWGEKRAQDMVTVDNDGAKQAVLRSMNKIFNVRRARVALIAGLWSLKGFILSLLFSVNQCSVHGVTYN